MNALMCPSNLSIRCSNACVSSTGESSRAAIKRAASAMVSK
jgi:hypothetical protein